MIVTMIATDEKPKVGKCMTSKLWYCIKDYIVGWGTTPRGAFQAMNSKHKQKYKEQK